MCIMHRSKITSYFKLFVSMVVILLFFVSCIRADTGTPTSDGGSRVEFGILQVQQLINQESMLRLTLDRQLQQLRSLVYDLQSKLSKTEERYQNQFRGLEANVYNITETFHAETSEKFSTLGQNIVDMRINMSSPQDRTREEDSLVYFSAFLTSSRTLQAANEVIKFDDVTVNEGGGYNPRTGKFTCPKTGVYLLSYGFLNSYAKATQVNMYINDVLVVQAFNPDQGLISAERSTVNLLNKGDMVDVRVDRSGAKLHGGRFTSFSAVYIH